MDPDGLDRRLQRALSRALPGIEAQLWMSPRPRPGWDPRVIPEGLRPGASLVPIFPRQGRAYIVLTVRSGELPQHAGQVSFPGGAVESGESAEQAALREAHEEVGIDPAAVRVLGRLTPLHIPASGFLLQPVVGWLDEPPALRACPREVEQVLESPLAGFGDGSRLGIETRTYKGLAIRVPHFRVAGYRVWGATAMVLGELLALLGMRLDPWREAGTKASNR